MTSPTYTTRLLLNLDVAENRSVDDVASWRDLADHAPFRQGARSIARRQLTRASSAGDAAPSVEDAQQLLITTFGDQPPTANDELERENAGLGAAVSDVAYVIAAIMLVPDTLEFPPGEEVPTIEHAGSRLVHATPWPHKACSIDEREAARILMEEFVSALPRELWRDDG